LQRYRDKDQRSEFWLVGWRYVVIILVINTYRNVVRYD
jgi:hypothetical protein